MATMTTQLTPEELAACREVFEADGGSWDSIPYSIGQESHKFGFSAGLAHARAESAKEILRLIETIKYLRGIAERGEGRECRDDEIIEQFVLGYVKKCEAKIADLKAQVEDETLEKAAKYLDAQATCPCNGDHGYCMENDPPKAYAKAIRAMKEKKA